MSEPQARSIRKIAESRLPTPYSEFRIAVYEVGDGKEHVVLSLGDLAGGPPQRHAQVRKADESSHDLPPLVRVHSECLTGDALFSLRCDCGAQLDAALQRIAVEGRGAVLYLRQEGRGIGLGNKIRAYELQDAGADTVEANHQLGFPADAREYGLAVDLLKFLGLTDIRLMTNNPRKLDALTSDGIRIAERVALESGRNPHNAAYLDAKRRKLGHLLDMP